MPPYFALHLTMRHIFMIIHRLTLDHRYTATATDALLWFSSPNVSALLLILPLLPPPSSLSHTFTQPQPYPLGNHVRPSTLRSLKELDVILERYIVVLHFPNHIPIFTLFFDHWVDGSHHKRLYWENFARGLTRGELGSHHLSSPLRGS